MRTPCGVDLASPNAFLLHVPSVLIYCTITPHGRGHASVQIALIQKMDIISLVLDFLVTSKARRRLLDALWRQNFAGSTADLADRAGVGFASAHRELRAMEAAGLVVPERQGRALVYRANHTHPLADALRAMTAAPVLPAEDAEVREVRGQLAALGAPLQHEPVEPSECPVEETLARGVRAAHRDPDVARTLPVCLYRQRDKLDPVRLRQQAAHLGEKQSLGFFLDLTAELSGDRRFAKWTKPLKDHRCKAARAFFYRTSRSQREQRLAEQRTPPVARRWSWRMNMDLDTFRSTFAKFEPHVAV